MANVLRLCEVAATKNLIINREVSAAILQNAVRRSASHKF